MDRRRDRSFGLYEQKNPQRRSFGEKRLMQVPGTIRGGLDDMVAEVIAAVQRFTGSQDCDDDLTVIAMELRER